MGLMDKLKAAKSRLTGDWADVTIAFDSVARGGSVTATTDVTVKTQAISIEGVVIEVQCEEIIDVPSASVYDNDGTSSGNTRRATNTETVVTKEIKVSGAAELEAGSTTTFTGELPIPASAPPSFDGRFARYEWKIRARVEMKGNDPDSGWQPLHVD
jgi:hypothetical protein